MERPACVAEKATIIKVTNKNIGSPYREQENMLLAAVNVDSVNVSGTMYIGGVAFNQGDVVYFTFFERKLETLICPAMLGVPSFQVEITSISKNKCL